MTAVSVADTCYETHLSNVIGRVASGVEGGAETSAANGEFSLGQNRPNPFGGGTVISYQLAAAGQVSLKVYNAAGQLVNTLVDQNETAGRHACRWGGKDRHGRSVSSGIYYYSIESGGRRLVRTMRLVK